MGSVLSWTVNGVLFAVGCLLAADTANEVIAATLLAPASEARDVGAPPPSERPRTWAARQVILDRNLFDSTTLAPPIETAEPIEDIEKSKLPVTLLGTFAASDPELSRATLHDRELKDTLVVGVGDQIKDKALVVRIERRRVVLRENGVARELTLDDEDSDRPVIQRARRTALPSRNRRARSELPVRKLDDDRFAVSRREVEETIKNPSNLLSQARVLPKFEEGEMVGLQVSSIKQGSLFSEIGLEDGDIITEFNGIAIDSPSESNRILQEMSDASEYTVVGERPDGSQFTRNFVPED